MSALKILIVASIVFSAAHAHAEPFASSPHPTYIQKSNLMSRTLKMNPGEMNISHHTIPRTVSDASELFTKVCQPNVENHRHQKFLEEKISGEFSILSFQCRTQEEIYGYPETIQFIATLDKENLLRDLQIIRMEATDRGQVFVAVAAGTLTSGLVAQGLSSDQNNKVLDAIAGGLLASTKPTMEPLNFAPKKNKAFWLSIASGIISGIVKEGYNSFRREKQTSSRDELEPVVTIRLKFEF